MRDWRRGNRPLLRRLKPASHLFECVTRPSRRHLLFDPRREGHWAPRGRRTRGPPIRNANRFEFGRNSRIAMKSRPDLVAPARSPIPRSQSRPRSPPRSHHTFDAPSAPAQISLRPRGPQCRGLHRALGRRPDLIAPPMRSRFPPITIAPSPLNKLNAGMGRFQVSLTFRPR